jgi:multidrug efflux system membrane fusion protein
VTPINTVTIRSRVDGQLMKVYYREGDMVQSGDPLIDLDQRPFQAQLEQAQGQLVRDQALLENARVDLSRYATLLKQNAVQEQIYRTQIATVAQYEGVVETDKGIMTAAKLNIIYCKITSPLSGLIGLRLVDPGNIVHATDTNGLLVITQIQPISVLFTIAEDQLQTVIRKVTGGQRLRASAFDRSDQTHIADGFLSTIDNQIDPATGTLRLRAVFDNQSKRLFPNQFVNIRLLVQEKRGVVLIPVAAIQRTTTREFVYVVKPDSTVTVRPITEGVTQGDETEIASGLSAGENVVVTGVDRLQEGTRVRMQIATSAPPSAGGKKK